MNEYKSMFIIMNAGGKCKFNNYNDDDYTNQKCYSNLI